HFGADEQAFMLTLAHLCAQALDRARLFDLAQQAREQAEKSAAQLRALQTVTDTALAHLTLDDLLRQLLARVTQALNVDNSAILLVDEEAHDLVVHMAHGPEENSAGVGRVPLGQGI